MHRVRFTALILSIFPLESAYSKSWNSMLPVPRLTPDVTDEIVCKGPKDLCNPGKTLILSTEEMERTNPSIERPLSAEEMKVLVETQEIVEVTVVARKKKKWHPPERYPEPASDTTHDPSDKL